MTSTLTWLQNALLIQYSTWKHNLNIEHLKCPSASIVSTSTLGVNISCYELSTVCMIPKEKVAQSFILAAAHRMSTKLEVVWKPEAPLYLSAMYQFNCVRQYVKKEKGWNVKTKSGTGGCVITGSLVVAVCMRVYEVLISSQYLWDGLFVLKTK